MFQPRDRLVLSHLSHGGLLAFLALLLGCSDGVNPIATLIRDSAGIQIAENRGSVDTPTLGILLDLERTQSFPSLELSYVRGMQLLADGRVVIANGGTTQLYFLEPRTGQSVAIGQRGDGPGEFRGFSGLYRCHSDSVAVLSPTARLSVMDDQGRLGRVDRVVNFSPYEYVGLASDCLTAWFMRMDLPPDYRRDDPFPVSIHSVQGSDSILVQVATVRSPETTPISGMQGRLRRPYGSDAVWLVMGDELILGRTDTAEVRSYGRDGTLNRVIRWTAARVPITTDDRSRYEQVRGAIAAQPDRAEWELIALDRITLPEAKPFFARLLADGYGNLWIQRYPGLATMFDNQGYTIFGPEGRFWWIFSPTGRLLGTGTTPEDFIIHDIRDGMVAGVRRDAEGVEVATLIPLTAAVRQALARSR